MKKTPALTGGGYALHIKPMGIVSAWCGGYERFSPTVLSLTLTLCSSPLNTFEGPRPSPGSTEVWSLCAWVSPVSLACPSRCRGLKRSVTEIRFVRITLPVGRMRRGEHEAVSPLALISPEVVV